MNGAVRALAAATRWEGGNISWISGFDSFRVIRVEATYLLLKNGAEKVRIAKGWSKKIEKAPLSHFFKLNSISVGS